jgi:tetratricopeptide (TPR) repeat protein
LLSQAAFSQSKMAIRAFAEFEKKNFDNAIALIDSAVVSDGKDDPQAWHIRGFIYKDYYKEVESVDFDASIRIISANSFFESNRLDSTGEFKARNKKVISFVASTLQNDAVRSLERGKYDDAIRFYDLFKDIKRKNDPEFNFRDFDIEFENALATLYFSIYEYEPREKAPYFDKSVEKYKQVLQLDPNNFRANLNLGVMYYNNGVDKIKNIDPDEVDIFTLHELQDECIELFKTALPFMRKAYEINPNRSEVLNGLAGIYFSLNDKENYNHFMDLLDKLEGRGNEDDND